MFIKTRILLCRDDGRSHAPGEDGCQAEASAMSASDSKALGLVTVKQDLRTEVDSVRRFCVYPGMVIVS